MTDRIFPIEEIKAFSQKWDLAEFAVFGSILREDFKETSDIDVMVTFKPVSPRSLFEMVRMQTELEQLFQRKVDLLSRGGVELSDNTSRKNAILDSIAVLYAAA